MNNITTSQGNLIELMAINEETLSKLYNLYAQKFSVYQDFWQTISSEEIEHGQWIRALLKRVNEGTALFNEGRFSKWALDSYSEKVKTEIVKTTQENVSPKYAANFALTLEQSMVENKFFEVFEGDAPDLKQVLIALEVSTNGHIERLKKLLGQI